MLNIYFKCIQGPKFLFFFSKIVIVQNLIIINALTIDKYVKEKKKKCLWVNPTWADMGLF